MIGLYSFSIFFLFNFHSKEFFLISTFNFSFFTAYKRTVEIVLRIQLQETNPTHALQRKNKQLIFFISH